MANTSQEWWHSAKKKVILTKKKMSSSQLQRRRKRWEELNKLPPNYKPKLININQQTCKKKNSCLHVISGKVKKYTG